MGRPITGAGLTPITAADRIIGITTGAIIGNRQSKSPVLSPGFFAGRHAIRRAGADASGLESLSHDQNGGS
jgi:hypothetical protein